MGSECIKANRICPQPFRCQAVERCLLAQPDHPIDPDMQAVLDAAFALAERAKYLGTRMQALRETMAELERGTRVERRSGYGRRPYDSIYKGEVERSSNHIVADEGKYGRRHMP